MYLKRCVAATVTLLALSASSLTAATMETRVPLHDGQLSSADLSRALLETAHLKGFELDFGTVDVRGLTGTAFVHALNTAMGDGCKIEVTSDALILHIDSDKLPHSVDEAKHEIEVFTAAAAPEATARQRRSYGLLMPQHVDPNKPLVVLVHGLDCIRWNWYPMTELLEQNGYQVAFFSYPSDGPLEESAKLLTEKMTDLRGEYPSMKIDIIAHSMGALVARRYVEGDDYAGGVDHLILLGPPNQGTHWANFRLALEVQEHYKLWKYEKDWSPTWAITDGLGEAGRDLQPRSEFIKHLDTLPRRAGVRYTIVAGNQSPVYPMTAKALEKMSQWVPDRAQGWWGFRQTEAALHDVADDARTHTGSSDGPVSVKSTQLDGVDDYTCLPATHMALMYPMTGQKPAAWDIIRDRLSH
jgi:pimeloyl-ACP methyl ester carboxylesterase